MVNLEAMLVVQSWGAPECFWLKIPHHFYDVFHVLLKVYIKSVNLIWFFLFELPYKNHLFIECAKY